MSGVIDSDGRQWERCNICSKWVHIVSLGYVKPSKAHPNGQDVCIECTNKMDHWHMSRVVPALNWARQVKMG